MLRPWTKILPFFFIEWYTKRYREVFHIKENDEWIEYNAPYPYTRFKRKELNEAQ